MDPEARVVVTAHDATGAAFASAEGKLRGFARGAMQLRSALAGFGVVLSGRAMAQWMSRAIETTEAVGEQREAVELAKEAFGEFKKASDELAESFAVQLTPAIGLAVSAFQEWKRITDPTQSQKLDQQIQATQREINRLASGIQKFEQGNFWQRIGGSEIWDKARADVEELRVGLQRLYAERDKAASVPEPSFDQFLGKIEYEAEMRRLANLEGLEEIKVRPPSKLPAEMRRDFDFAAASAAVLNSELQEIGAVVTKMPDDLKQFSPQFTNAAASLRKYNDELSKSKEFAKSIGENFRDAFASWMSGTERSFSDFLRNLAAQLATSAIFDSLAGFFKGGTGKASSFFADFFGGFRANGGPVSAGRGYVVGERGPELFVPGSSGMIAANAGGPPIEIHMHVQAGLPPQWTAQLTVAAQAAAGAAYEAVTAKMNGRR